MALFDWLQKKQQSRQSFEARLVALLKQRLPSSEIEFDDMDHAIYFTVNGREATAFTDNLWREFAAASKDEAQELLERWLASVTEVGSDDQRIHPESLVLIVKDITYFGPHGRNAAAECVREHLVADLWVVVALDTPTSTRSISPNECEALAMTLPEVKAMALENLRRILPDVERNGDGSRFFMLTAGGDYTASLLLLDEVWEGQAEEVQGEIVAVVPSRDVLLFTGSSNPEGIAAMRRSANGILETGSHLISGTMLRRQNGRWVSYS